MWIDCNEIDENITISLIFISIRGNITWHFDAIEWHDDFHSFGFWQFAHRILCLVFFLLVGGDSETSEKNALNRCKQFLKWQKMRQNRIWNISFCCFGVHFSSHCRVIRHCCTHRMNDKKWENEREKTRNWSNGLNIDKHYSMDLSVQRMYTRTDTLLLFSLRNEWLNWTKAT